MVTQTIFHERAQLLCSAADVAAQLEHDSMNGRIDLGAVGLEGEHRLHLRAPGAQLHLRNRRLRAEGGVELLCLRLQLTIDSARRSMSSVLCLGSLSADRGQTCAVAQRKARSL